MRGAAMMVAAMMGFTLNDACMKGLSGVVPLGQAVFLRGVLATAMLGALGLALGQLRLRLTWSDARLVGLRTVAEALAALFFITAIFNMPLSDATAILQTLPLSVALGAAIFLGEPLGWRRLLAIAVGLVGVLMIVKPGGEGFTPYSLLALATVAMVTCRDLVVRRITSAVPSLTVAFYAAAGVTVVFGLYSTLTPWVALTPASGGRIGLATFFLIGAYTMSVGAMRVGDVGFIAPFRYTALIAGIGVGMVLFDERPDLLSWTGAGIILATGLFTLYRERQLARRTVDDLDNRPHL